MGKPVLKVFRAPSSAEKALSQLKKEGFKDDEIGAIALAAAGRKKLSSRLLPSKSSRASLPGGVEIVAYGAAAAALKDGNISDDLATTLRKSLELTEETANYYEFVLKVGAVLLSVYAEGDRGARALKILQSAETLPERKGMAVNSPGFLAAGRMTATDPLDEKMTGDFRRY